MRVRDIFITSILIIGSLICTACDQGGEIRGSVNFSPGTVFAVTAGSTEFNMVYAVNKTGIDFPTGTGDAGTATITRTFFIGETEVTNALVAAVLQWAYDNDMFSSNSGDDNFLGTSTVKYGGNELLDLDSPSCHIVFSSTLHSFSVEEGYENFPVVMISWYGAVMLCNWLTEMDYGNADNVVYAWVDNGDGVWQDDETDEDASQGGYRLPSADEWEYAARYVNGIDWLYGDHASGDETGACHDCGDVLGGQAPSLVFGNYAWYDDNSDTGSGNELHGIRLKTSNRLGLFDMSGNAREWCFTASGAYRIARGGGWNIGAESLQVGDAALVSAEAVSESTGFRLAKSE